MHRALARTLLVLPLVLAVAPSRGLATDGGVAEVPPARHALVIGNSEYDALDDVPSSSVDATRMSELLTRLGFSVTRASFQNVPQLERDHLVEFKRKIRDGDLIVVFFSGHGFSFRGYNYLAATELSQPATPAALSRSAVAVENLQDFFSCHAGALACESPGLVLFLVDACRSITEIELQEPGQPQVLKGGSTYTKPVSATNLLVGYAAERGKTAAGTVAAGQPSIYTRFVLPELEVPGIEIEDALKNAASEVLLETGATQHPGLVVWSTTRAILQPSAQQLEDERQAWLAAVNSGEHRKVASFLRRHSISRQAALARKWLQEHPEDVVVGGFTRISPLAVERAWRDDTDQPRVAIRRPEVPLGFQREVPAAAVPIAAGSLGLVASGTTAAEIRSLAPREDRFFEFSAFEAHGSAVLLESAPAYASSALDSPGVAATLEAGTLVRLLSIEASGPDEVLVQASAPQLEAPVWVALERRGPEAPVELGRSLRQVRVGPRDDGPRDLVDPLPIQERLAELRSGGNVITWIAIAAGPPSATELGDEVEARLAHLLHVLRTAGIDGRRITVTTGASGVPDGLIRLRFFGYSKEG